MTVPFSPTDAIARLSAQRWSPEQAWTWQRALPWLVGCNYNPAYAGNQLEWLSRGAFDAAAVERELGWAQSLGLTSMRVFLHDLCWQQDPAGFLATIDRLLGIADSKGIGLLLTFFDSCWHPVPRLGAQRGPEPFTHNSLWVQSPGAPVLRDAAKFAALEPYVTGMIAHFRNDRRIHGWDLWNEPDNRNDGAYGPRDLGAAKADTVLPLLAQTFAWARAARPSQPLTSGIWWGDYSADKLSPFQRLQVEASDIVSFHSYRRPEETAGCIRQLQAQGRPLWCTEFMARGANSTFAGILPLLKEHHVGAWCWGFVQGRTQTHMPWDSWQRQYDAEPELWFHEILRGDGTPYRTDEAELIRRLTRRG